MKTQAFHNKMSSRVKRLYDHLIAKALGDRSEEWFTQDMFDNVVKDEVLDEQYPLWKSIQSCSVIVRRAVSLNRMLLAMTDEHNSLKTHTAEIQEGDLLLGVMPMESNGLGKMFPPYFTDDELRAGSIINRNPYSLFGYNTMNYEELLCDGLQKKIDECSAFLDNLSPLIKALREEIRNTEKTCGKEDDRLFREKMESLASLKRKFDSYWSVKLSCRSVIDYANRFAALAEKEALKYPDRAAALHELAQIARKVPAHKAETFHEAMQSICFFHIALHVSMNLISLGQLDQVLIPYLKKEQDKDKALEIFECFILKCAARLNLTSKYLVEQDHVDYYATVLGMPPYLIDQNAGVNNFLQNIIIGGKNPDGTDATNECTYLILQAFENVNLPAPGLYVRIHENTPEELFNRIAASVYSTKNNPTVLAE
jgi:formate C-acetyltransferase